MKELPAPISEKNAVSSIVSGLATLLAVLILAWRWLLK